MIDLQHFAIRSSHLDLGDQMHKLQLLQARKSEDLELDGGDHAVEGNMTHGIMSQMAKESKERAKSDTRNVASCLVAAGGKTGTHLNSLP
ncbi:hypothetical protein NC653_028956 [Populus alba x Populus x berolinensis]|uniref:Uncharacterized protein n=1 Tax=Populus alba x Populus x berolinensis TaxID=444605 RepID=A0AAD6M3Q9_9ROSI|nr:hypothetical protein NC653_028956 [Populus alba x Populus x berolinensis]